jgi:hypothetical protein
VVMFRASQKLKDMVEKVQPTKASARYGVSRASNVTYRSVRYIFWIIPTRAVNTNIASRSADGFSDQSHTHVDHKTTTIGNLIDNVAYLRAHSTKNDNDI